MNHSDVSNTHRTLTALCAFALALCCSALLAGGASAATFTVDVNSDNGALTACTAAAADCSLRGAITAANALAGDDAIDFDPAASAPMIDAPLPDVTETLSIDGAGVVLSGSASYAANCLPDLFAFKATAAPLERKGLPILGVCGRAAESTTAAPTLQVGPRRSDNSVSISGLSGGGQIELYRAEPPAVGGEASAVYASGIPSNGSFSYKPPVEPSAGERFTATLTDAAGSTSTFSSPVTTPADLTSPTFQRAVAISDNAVRLDFSESISPAVIGQLGAFSLSMGGIAREITNVEVDGSSVYLTTLTTPWNTGDAGSVAFTGSTRVTDMVGNEVLGEPSAGVYAGPGELSAPTISRLRMSHTGFCQKRTKRCTKRTKVYIYFTVNKPARVTFTIMRASGRRFVVRYTHRYEKGSVKSGLTASMRGRTLPARGLIVQVVAEDVARNLSAPVETAFRVAKRNLDLRSRHAKRKNRRSHHAKRFARR